MQQVTCDGCGATFMAEVWLIIDVSERLDLVQNIHDGTLNKVTCPACQKTIGQVDAPLLIYCPGEPLPLLFSPAQHASREQNLEYALDLIDLLRVALGEAWQVRWLRQGLVSIPRSQLSAAMSDD